MKYDEAIDWLYGTQMFGIKLGLENVSRLLLELDLYRNLKGRKIIHVAGTNGKGSVCAFADAMLREADIKTGLFTSPHLITFEERIQVSGEMITRNNLVAMLTDLRERVADWDPHPTFFELTFAVALQHFCESDVEVIILETGMGGRLDATNSIRADVSIITQISLDHQEWLGETIREIAAEKAGIIKPEIPCVIADLHPEARDVVGRTALALRIPLIEAHPLPEEWELGIPGEHQKENAALAVEAVCRVAGDDDITRDQIRAGLANTHWPARFQTIKGIVIDGAHNPDAATVLVKTWQEKFGDQKASAIFGAVESKDVSAVLEILKPIIGELILCPLSSQRGLDSDTLKAHAAEAGIKVPIQVADSATKALELQSDERRLITGSLFLAGEMLSIFGDGTAFQVSEQ